MTERLALFGGEPLETNHADLRISWPRVSQDDRGAILATFDRGDFSGRSSSEVRALEDEMAAYFGMPFGTALNSGTSALHAALHSLGVKSDDEVIVPNLTFVATAMAVLHNGSIPRFADVDCNSYNLTAKTIAARITKQTKAVIVVHMHGTPAEIDPIIALCRQHNIRLIEDVAQAPGAKYKGKFVGSFGDASVFSLMSQKNLATCGECGVLLSKTLQAKNAAERLRIYGEVVRPGRSRAYNSYTLGWNYTLNPIQAAMARIQLAKFSELTAEIRRAAVGLSMALKVFKWVSPPNDGATYEGVFHFYRFGLDPAPVGYTDKGRFRKAVQDALAAEGLNTRQYQNCPISGQPVFRSPPFDKMADYNIELYPNVLEVLRSTLVLGGIGSSPAYLLKDGTTEKYVAGFAKIDENIDELIAYARSLDYSEPWHSVPKTSDSLNAEYVADNSD